MDKKRYNFNKIAVVLILVGAGLYLLAWAIGFRGGSLVLIDWRLEVEGTSFESHVLGIDQEIQYVYIETLSISVIIEPTSAGEAAGLQLINIPLEAASIENGRISIDTRSAERQRGIRVFGMGFANASTRREIRITLPADTLLSEIDASSVSGSFNIGVDALHISANSTSGSINLNNAHWETLLSESISGSIRVRGGRFMDYDSGETRLQTTSGSVNVEIANNQNNFMYSAATTSGNVRINGQNHGRGTVSGGSGEHQVFMRTISGSVTLDSE
ncbi:MAG: DUF4097 domain-containing protein [Defluviitaleaceae bacterium]|nr:DUF4097 domain-containing protein [Defluviitaleaceae bacterium]